MVLSTFGGAVVTSPSSSVSSLHQQPHGVRPRHAASSSIASTGSTNTSSASSSVISTPGQSSTSGSSHQLALPSSTSQTETRLKRALAGARKKVSRKPPPMSASSHDDGGMTSGDEYSSQGLSVAQRAARWGEQVRANTGPPLSRLGNVFGKSKSKEPRSPTNSSAMPPIPPPKPGGLRAKTAAAAGEAGDSPITTSPSMQAALLYINNPPELSPVAQRPAISVPPNVVRRSHEDEERDEMTPTHLVLRRTVTADPLVGSRRTSVAATIRPVSGAPSVDTIKNTRTGSGSASGHTTDAEESPSVAAPTPAPVPVAPGGPRIVPLEQYYNASKESFTSPSYSDLHARDMDSHRHTAATASGTAPERARLGTSDLPFTVLPPSSFSPTPNVTKQQKRRSMSLDLGRLVSSHKNWHLTHQVPPTPPTALATPSGSVSSASLASREDVRGIIGASHAPSPSSGHASDSGGLFRNRLAALNLANPMQHPPPPPSHPSSRKHGHHQSSSMVPSAYSPPLPPRRPAAVSMQSLQQSLGPAAATASSVAIGFGKRAYDRVEKLWGGSNSSASSSVGGPSAPSRAQRTFVGTPLLRVQSNNAQTALNNALTPEKKPGILRRTPNAPSGDWKVYNTDEESSVATGRGADLGPCLRPGKVAVGYGSPGLVFGRPLADCVRDTRTVPRVLDMSNKETHTAPAKDVEQRLLPAMIVRCSQHLVRWGVEEEGLFRISGRASHITKVRTSFDTGADYDLREAGPGQLDPHAVASSFKAFLRELPEPILTRSLSAKFDEVIASSPTTQTKQTQEFYGLPAGPAGSRAIPQMRKPPSLSALGPACNASPSILHKLSVLIARLPQENRDLLYTLIELLKLTAANVGSTKMPMANLLLLFCPSLQISPSVLRLLCEAEGVWDGPLPAPEDESPQRELPSPVFEEPPSPETPEASPGLRLVSGPGLGALGGGPRQRTQALNSSTRTPIPGISSPDLTQEMFTVTPLQTPTPPALVSSSAGNNSPYFYFSPPPSAPARKATNSSEVGFPLERPPPQSPRTSSSSAARSPEGSSTGESGLKRRLSIFGLGGGKSSAASSTSNLDNPSPSSSLRGGGKRIISRPSLLLLGNRRSSADLLNSPPSPGPRTSQGPPPVLSLPESSPTFSVSMESLMGDDEQPGADRSTVTLVTSSNGSGASSDYARSVVNSEEPMALGVPHRGRNNRSRSPSPADAESNSTSTPARYAPVGVPLRAPSPGPNASMYGQLSPHDRKPSLNQLKITAVASSADQGRPRTPIADMFRSASRLGIVDDREDDDDEQIVLLPPLGFTGSPMFKSPTASTPMTGALNAPVPAPAPATNPPSAAAPRLDFHTPGQHRRTPASGNNDDDDWTRLVLGAARTSTDGRPPRGS